jgi:single-stranded DNA-binding protein
MTNTTKKHYSNYENITIKGNIGSDIVFKTKTKERAEFSVAVNSFNKITKTQKTKWFKIIAFDEIIISALKNNSDYKKGANVEIRGTIEADIYKDQVILKIIAKQLAFNVQIIEESA